MYTIVSSQSLEIIKKTEKRKKMTEYRITTLTGVDPK